MDQERDPPSRERPRTPTVVRRPMGLPKLYASISASSSVVRKRMTRMPPAGYPAPQYLQSDRVSELLWRPASLVAAARRAVHRAVVPELPEVSSLAALPADDARPGASGAVGFRA